MSTLHGNSRPGFSPLAGLQNPSFIPAAKARKPRRSGFTLVEMLVVVSISTLLLSLAANVAQDVVVGNQITTAGETVTDELRLARHTAQVRNRVVEVRFYKPTAPNAMGDEVGVSSLQTFIYDQDNRVAKPVREVRRLPEGVRISEDSSLSPLLAESRLKSDWKEGDMQISLPDAGTDYAVYRIRFLPDGSTDLNTQQQWFLTLYGRNDQDHPPANYVTVQVKPARGTVRSFRPN